MYSIDNPERLAVGQTRILWRGMYGRHRESGLAMFVECLPTRAPAVADVLRRMPFHLAPVTCYTRLRKGLEAALALHLSRLSGFVGSCQDMEALRNFW